jgi:hypothetical protein
MLSQAQLILDTDSTLSDNRNPKTRGSHLRILIKSIIDSIFLNRTPFTISSSGGNSVILSTQHNIKLVTNVRLEDMNGNQIFISNRIDPTNQTVYVFSDLTTPYRIKLY